MEEHNITDSVHSPSSTLVINIMCVQTLCEHLNVLYIFDETDLYRFEVMPELHGANVRLVI